MSELRAASIAAQFIAEREKFEARAYPDPLRGWSLPTIGYGTTTYPDGRAVRRGDVIDETKARVCMTHFITSRCLPAIRSIPTWPHMSDNQKAALISFGYNLGPRFYRAEGRESITRLCISPELWGNAQEVVGIFLKYRNPGTDVEDGLRLRRLLEAHLFLTKEK